jgi:hypothetical protein
VNRQTAKEVNHVHLGALSILVSAKCPGLRAVIIVNVEDSEIIWAESVGRSKVLAELRDPTLSPVVPVRMHGMEVLPESSLHAPVFKSRLDEWLAVKSSDQSKLSCESRDERNLGDHVV